MARRFFLHTLSRLSRPPLSFPHSSHLSLPLRLPSPTCFVSRWDWKNKCWDVRYMSHGRVNLVLTEGQPKFETYDEEPTKKEKWRTKKQVKVKRKREKQKRKAANKKDPRWLGVKGKKSKQKFKNAAERINYKIEKARVKEALLLEKLKKYEVPQIQGPTVEPEHLTGEERFYLKRMSQKRSNYAPIGRRGIFGGVIQNMYMHWKKHETVKVVCNKACKRDQIHEYSKEIARLSGGIPIQIIGNDTIVFYRGKNYVQPKEMIPRGTLSKKKALTKSKYEQSLESVRRFIAISEKELELYYRHVALYGDPNSRNLDSASFKDRKESSKVDTTELDEVHHSSGEDFLTDLSDVENSSGEDTSSEYEADSGGEDLFEVNSDS